MDTVAVFCLHTRPEFPWTRSYMKGCFSVIFDILTSCSCQFQPNVSTSMYKRGAEPNISWLIKQHIFKPKWNCRKKSMQEKRKRICNGCLIELKIPSLGITVRHNSASLVLRNSYPRDRIFNPNLTTIKILIVYHVSLYRLAGQKKTMLLLWVI